MGHSTLRVKVCQTRLRGHRLFGCVKRSVTWRLATIAGMGPGHWTGVRYEMGDDVSFAGMISNAATPSASFSGG